MAGRADRPLPEKGSRRNPNHRRTRNGDGPVGRLVLTAFQLVSTSAIQVVEVDTIVGRQNPYSVAIRGVADKLKCWLAEG